MNMVADVHEIKHLVCLKCGWGLPLVPSQKFIQLEIEFRKQHEGHSLCVLTTAELHELGEKRAELRKYANSARGWAEVNKELLE
jgi:hypothetical protein